MPRLTKTRLFRPVGLEGASGSVYVQVISRLWAVAPGQIMYDLHLWEQCHSMPTGTHVVDDVVVLGAEWRKREPLIYTNTYLSTRV